MLLTSIIDRSVSLSLHFYPIGKRWLSKQRNYNAIYITLEILVLIFNYNLYFTAGTEVTQLVEALRYKSEGRGFDSRWCHWNFSLT